MKQNLIKEIIALILVLAVFISIRSVHFSQRFNFSTEQALFASKSLELWKQKKIEFLGPPISYRYNGRYLFQGSITYYAMLPFLILGQFDPVRSSYFFMLFCGFMLFPLYTGVRYLSGKKSAWIVVIGYSMLPLYVNYTMFFWNPNLQMAFTPLLILLLGLHKQLRNRYLLMLSGVVSGVLLLFHYQFVLVILLLLAYIFFLCEKSIKNVILFLLCAIIGFSPMLLFEVRNHFYNTQTLILFLQHFNEVFGKKGTTLNDYYFLSIFLVCAAIGLYMIRKYISRQYIVIFFTTLFIIDAFLYYKVPENAFGMAKDWNFDQEMKTSLIIRSQNVNNFNIANTIYDTPAAVQKYLLQIAGQEDKLAKDYWRNKYLFVLSSSAEFRNDSAYEVRYFRPSVIRKKWGINKTYSLYLVERTE